MTDLEKHLREVEVIYFYNELKANQNMLQRIYCAENSIKERMGFIEIHEAVIEPALIRIKSDLNNLEELNKEFSKERIFFEYDKSIHGYYNQEKDEIHIFLTNNSKKLEIEAMIGHELIHREQNKRSGQNYFEQAKKWTAKANELASRFNRTQSMDVYKEHQAMAAYINQDNPYEKMTYVYQTVKEYPNYTPTQIVNYLRMFGFNIDAKLKKYVGMYYLIKDKI